MYSSGTIPMKGINSIPTIKLERFLFHKLIRASTTNVKSMRDGRPISSVDILFKKTIELPLHWIIQFHYP